MRQKLIPFDPAEHLKSHRAIAEFIAQAFETKDISYIAHALKVADRAKKKCLLLTYEGRSSSLGF